MYETLPSALSSLSLKYPHFGAIGGNMSEMLFQSLKEMQMA